MCWDSPRCGKLKIDNPFAMDDWGSSNLEFSWKPHEASKDLVMMGDSSFKRSPDFQFKRYRL